MADNVLRAFLVSLGWEVDTAGMNRFATAIAVQSEAVRELGEVMKAAALKVGGFVRDIVDDLDKVYFTSKQTKASVANLDAFKYALEQVGQSGEQGFNNLKNFYNLLATDPKNEALWLKQNLDVEAFDRQTGKLRDTFTVYMEALQSISKKQYQQPYFDAKAMGGGIDKTFLDAATSPEALKAIDDYRARLKASGVDAEKAAEDAHELASAIRSLNSEIQILKEAVLPALKAQWDQLSPQTRETIQDYLDLGKQIGRLTYWWEHLDEQTKTTIKWTLGLVAGAAALVIGLVAVSSVVLLVVSAFTALISTAGLWMAAIALVVVDIAGLVVAFKTIAWDKIGAEWDAFTGKVKALSSVFTTNLKPVLTDIGQLLKDLFTGNWGAVKKDAEAIGGVVKDAWKQGTDALNAPAKTQPGQTAAPAAVAGSVADLFTSLEKKYNLPAGITDSVYAAESDRGKNLHSKKGAMGPFQFMPETAKEYGLDNPYSIGASAEAFAQKMSHLLKYYKGDLKKAIAAYNWGEGNLDRQGLDHAPKETRDYVPKVLRGLTNPYAAEAPAVGPATIHQTITTTVTGAADPQGVSKAVTGAIDNGNVFLARALQGRTS